ncbi:hypothetical protein M1307_02305 [Patescibacteria group bacterium]|nr:hypothetical protein [Patescibacteria group bacterium]
MVFIVFLPNLKLLWQFFIGSLTANFTSFNLFLAIFISILFGIYFSLFVFFLRKRRQLVKSGKAGFLASFLGIMGVGCSSCGAVILSMFLSTGGAASVISLLPFKGSEFALISVAVLLFSIYLMAKNIVNAGICKISS